MLGRLLGRRGRGRGIGGERLGWWVGRRGRRRRGRRIGGGVSRWNLGICEGVVLAL